MRVDVKLPVAVCGMAVIVALAWRTLGAARPRPTVFSAHVPVAPTPPGSLPPLVDSLRAIEAWHRDHHRPSFEALRPGIDRARVDALAAGRASPQLYELYAWHDGDTELVPGWRFRPLADALAESESIARITWNPSYWDARWIPFLTFEVAGPIFELDAANGATIFAFEKEDGLTNAYQDLATLMAEHAEAFASGAYRVDDEGEFMLDEPLRAEVAAHFGHGVSDPRRRWVDAGDGQRRENGEMIEERRFDERGREIYRSLSGKKGPYRTVTTTRFDDEGRPIARSVQANAHDRPALAEVRAVSWTYAPPDHVTITSTSPGAKVHTVLATRRPDGSLCVLSNR